MTFTVDDYSLSPSDEDSFSRSSFWYFLRRSKAIDNVILIVSDHTQYLPYILLDFRWYIVHNDVFTTGSLPLSHPF